MVSCGNVGFNKIQRSKSPNGKHSHFVKRMLNSRPNCNRIIPKKWIDMVKAVLEPEAKLYWRAWFKEDAKTIEQGNKVRSTNISQDQLFGEGDYATVERQSFSDDHALTLCCAEVLNAWDRAGEVGTKNDSFTNVTQGPKGAFIDFLERMTLLVNRKILNLDARKNKNSIYRF